MNYEEYIKRLDSLDDDLEEGMLSELQQKPPLNLHENIMNSINRDRKRISFLNFKMYMPVVAAVLVFTVVINKPEIIKKLGLIGSHRPVQEQTAVGNPTAATKNNGNSGDSTQKNFADSSLSAQSSSVTEKNTTVSNKNNSGSKTDSENIKGNSKDGKINVASGKDGSSENIKTAVENDNTPVDLAGILGFVFLKEPEVNYEVVLTNNEADVISYISSSENGKVIEDNVYIFTIDKFRTLDEMLTKDQVIKTAVNTLDEQSKEVAIKVVFVNYGITISDNQPEIMKFFSDNTKSKALGDNTYKLSSNNFKELDAMLAKGNIEKKVLSDINGEFVFIKVLTVNYEISVNNSSETVNFIKEKCFNIQDNLYRVNRNDFAELEIILQKEAVDEKLINESQSQDSSIVLRILIN